MCDSVSLDTLAQLSTTTLKPLSVKGCSEHNETLKKEVESLQKKAKAKTTTNAIIFQMVDLKSPLRQSYWSTYHCANVILQDGDTISSKYCKQRWCLVCNRIRTANLINGYAAPLNELSNPYFVTLTIPNVQAKELRRSLEGMQQSFTRIRKNIKKTYKLQLKGIKKVECTYNPKRNDYHPHYHLLIDGKEEANKLVSLWLEQYPAATICAQDIREANDTSIKELFKYFTKVVNKDSFHPEEMDIIFRAMRGKRVFQPLGIKKQVSEEIEEIQSQKILSRPPQQEILTFQTYDWVDSYGEVLSGFIPTSDYLEWIEKIKKPKNLKYQL